MNVRSVLWVLLGCGVAWGQGGDRVRVKVDFSDVDRIQSVEYVVEGRALQTRERHNLEVVRQQRVLDAGDAELVWDYVGRVEEAPGELEGERARLGGVRFGRVRVEVEVVEGGVSRVWRWRGVRVEGALEALRARVEALARPREGVRRLRARWASGREVELCDDGVGVWVKWSEGEEEGWQPLMLDVFEWVWGETDGLWEVATEGDGGCWLELERGEDVQVFAWEEGACPREVEEVWEELERLW